MKYNEYPFINVPGTNNAEIEDKETILLPDGRSYSVNGKKHSEGGINVMLPTGTKVFSDYLKLPKKTVGSLLDTENNKKKMSPADIVKQYDTLPYHDILNSNSNRYNSMAKRTANAMIMKLNALHDDVFMAQEEYKKEQGIDKETPIMQDGGLYDFVEYEDGGQHLPQYQMGELTDYPEDPLLTLMNNIYGQYNSQDNLVEELPGYVFNNTNNLSTDPVTVPQYNKDIYKKGEQPRMSPEIIKTLNNNEYKFEVNDPYNAIPSTQRSNKDGTYGEQVSYEDFTNNNSWYDFSNFDIKNKDNVADFQSKYNEQLTNMAESFGMTPEQLIKEIGFSGNRGTKSLDGLGGEYTLTRKLPSKIPVPVTSIATPPNPVIKESEPIKLPLPKSAKPVTTPAPRGISQRDYINGIQNGLVLSELAALDIDNPYYSFSPSQVATTRYEPVNTKQSERAFNIAKESIENSNLPESVKMAQLAQMQGNLLSGINQVDITNAQNNLQNQNQNTSNLLNTLNNDLQKREQSNMNYVRDRAIGREAFDMTRNEMIGSVLNNWKASVKNKRDEELMSMLSNNYDLVDGKPVYVEGRGYVNNYENLDNYNKVYSLDENIAMVQDRLDKLLKKKKQGK
jgi:hypothetical protein